MLSQGCLLQLSFMKKKKLSSIYIGGEIKLLKKHEDWVYKLHRVQNCEYQLNLHLKDNIGCGIELLPNLPSKVHNCKSVSLLLNFGCCENAIFQRSVIKAMQFYWPIFTSNNFA